MRIDATQEDLLKRGIYAIRNVVCCKLYIGQTRTSFGKRLLEHRFDLNSKRRNDSRYLQRSYDKYGGDAFIAVIQEIAPENLPQNKLTKWLNERETFWIKYYRRVLGERNVFNLNDGGDGHYTCEETRELISKRGKERYEKDPSLRNKISAHMREHWGDPTKRKHRTLVNQESNRRPEAKRKNSESQKKRWAEQHDRLLEANRRTHSTKEHGKYTSKMNKDRWKDPEVKRRHAEGTAAYWAKPESHNKRSEQMRKRMEKEIIEKRKLKRESEKFLDAILYMWYQIHPEHIDACPSHKFRILNKIANILRNAR